MSGWNAVEAVCFAVLAGVSLFLAYRFYKGRVWLGVAMGLGLALLHAVLCLYAGAGLL